MQICDELKLVDRKKQFGSIERNLKATDWDKSERLYGQYSCLFLVYNVEVADY